MPELNPQHDVLCPEGHVIFRWTALNCYDIMGHYGFKYHAESKRSFYSCPVCGDVDVEENGLHWFNGCVFNGANMPDPIQGAAISFARGIDGVLRLEA